MIVTATSSRILPVAAPDTACCCASDSKQSTKTTVEHAVNKQNRAESGRDSDRESTVRSCKTPRSHVVTGPSLRIVFVWTQGQTKYALIRINMLYVR